MSMISHNSNLGGAASAAVMLIAASARVAESLSALRAGSAQADAIEIAGPEPTADSLGSRPLPETRSDSPPTYSRPAAAVSGAATPPNGVASRAPSPAPTDAWLKATFAAAAPARLPTELAVA